MLATAALWVRTKTSLKNAKMGDINKGVPTHSRRPEKYTKKLLWMDPSSHGNKIQSQGPNSQGKEQLVRLDARAYKSQEK